MVGSAHTIMNKRKEIKKEHERALIKNFLKWHNPEYKIVGEPDPPEAIIKFGNKTTWIEVADTFFTWEYARDEYSYATPDETHIPMTPGPYFNGDEQFANRFVKVLKDKLTKPSYLPFKRRYGPGILLIGMRSPFFDKQTVDIMREKYQAENWSDDLGCFEKIYITAKGYNPLEWCLIQSN